MPILALQNANYNPMSPTSRINSIQPTQPLTSFSSLSCDVPLEMHSFSLDTLCPENPKYFARNISLPCTSQNSVTSQEYSVNHPGAVKFKEDENYPKNKQWTDFSYGIAENTSYPSSANLNEQYNFASGIKNSNFESHISEHSYLVASSSEGKNACKIPNTIRASEARLNCKKNPEDKTFGRKARALKKKMDVPQKMKKPSYKCSKCQFIFRRKDYLESHERCHNVEKLYVCKFCDKAFTESGILVKHIRSHTGEKPYTCSKCSKTYSQNFTLKRHMLKHIDEDRCKCDSCDDEFSSEESLGGHKSRKNK
ncbi:hypothetical protein CDAR_455421 [Caerostris darwini]|uniref:C2H2-type domain-containing protein n=1 Tax=Caerostris darwini TaxID=1538125 RepID=A0AAV4TQ98_9ARAC|nr:hypothetical protein CDAR_455421 [Caerostris darwini]